MLAQRSKVKGERDCKKSLKIEGKIGILRCNLRMTLPGNRDPSTALGMTKERSLCFLEQFVKFADKVGDLVADDIPDDLGIDA